MKKKNTLYIIIVTALFVGLSFYSVQNTNKKLDLVTVIEFTRTIDGNTNIISDKIVGEKDVREVSIQAGSLPEGAITSMDDIVGKMVNTVVYSGTYAYEAQVQETTEDTFAELFETTDISKLRTCTIPVALEDALAGDLKPGDRVDIIYSGSGSKPSPDGYADETFNYTIPFMEDVWVYKTNTESGYRYENYTEQSYTEAAIDYEPVQLVTFIGDKKDMIELKNRAKVGMISVMGRLSESENYQVPGHVLGDYEKIFSGFAEVETNKTTIETEKVLQ